MGNRNRSLLGRFVALIRGSLLGWMRDREERSPRAVYEQAIQERTRHYADLKRAVAGILYTRNKLEGEIDELRHALTRTHEDIRGAVRRGDDEAALALVHRKHALAGELERAEQEVERIRTEAEEAKGNLVRFREEIRQLEREKVRMLATLANAKARRRIEEALDGFSLEGEMRALESVREYVARVQTEGHLDAEVDDGGLESRIKAIRADARDEAARQELAEIKRRLRPTVLNAQSGAMEIPVANAPVQTPATG